MSLDLGSWQQVSSQMAKFEIEAIPDRNRRNRVQLLLPAAGSLLKLTEAVYERAATLETLGFKPADAVHVAAAESLKVDVFLSCDDRLCRLAKRRQTQLTTAHVANPLDWLKEMGHAIDS